MQIRNTKQYHQHGRKTLRRHSFNNACVCFLHRFFGWNWIHRKLFSERLPIGLSQNYRSRASLSVREGANLWVTAQGGKVLQLKTPGLETLRTYSLPSPHGIFMSYNNRRVYVLNIATGGKDVVHVFEQKSGNKISCPVVNTMHSSPNNAVLSYENDWLFISHAIDGQSFNSMWAVDVNTGCVDPSSEKVFLSGELPFGVRVIPPFGKFCNVANSPPYSIFHFDTSTIIVSFLKTKRVTITFTIRDSK